LSLLTDLFGYLSVVLHGLTIVAQSMAIGGVLFLAFLVRPLSAMLPDGATLARRACSVAGWSALALVVCEVFGVGMQVAVLMDSAGLALDETLTAQFAVAGGVKAVAAGMLGTALLARRPIGSLPLLVLCVLVLGSATMTTHAAARTSDCPVLLAATALHILGAAIWIGGIPFFLMVLGRLRDGVAFRQVGARFSRMSIVGVGCIVVSAAAMSWFYIGSWSAAYGTAYGVMVGAKLAMFVALLLLGLGNFLVVERLRADPGAPVLRMRRFAEVEIGIGFSVIFAAASLTSVPPAVDLRQDRVTWAEIVEHNIPRMPRLVSPDHDSLALPALQARLDAEAGQARTAAAPAFTPGSGELPARNAADVAWSEYNHHWAGLFIAVIGVLGLLHRGGLRAARH